MCINKNIKSIPIRGVQINNIRYLYGFIINDFIKKKQEILVKKLYLANCQIEIIKDQAT